MSSESALGASGARLRLALDMFEAGEQMMRASLMRRHPDATPIQIEDLLREWLADRPGAARGDAVPQPLSAQ